MKHFRACLTAFAAVLLIVSLTVADETRPGDAAEKTTVKIEWKTSWDDAAAVAKNDSRLILMLFTNPDDSSRSRKMEKNIWAKKSVAEFVNETFVPLRIHTAKVENHAAMKKFKVESVPVTIVLNADKKIIARSRYYRSSRTILSLLKKAATVPAMEKKVAENPEDVEATFQLAKVYRNLGRKSEAKPYLEKVCELDADNAGGKKMLALFILAGFDMADGKHDEVKKKYEEFLKLDPDDKTGYRDDVALQLALLPYLKSNFGIAIEKLNKFLEDFPKSKLRAEASFYLGSCMLLSKKEADAEKIFIKLIKDFPKTKYGKQATQMRKQIEQLRKLRERPPRGRFGG